LTKPEIIRLEASQFDRAVGMLGRAFHDYPIMCYAAPDAARRARAVPRLYGGILRYCLWYGEVYTTSDAAGAACWLPPGGEHAGFFGMVRAGMLGIPFRFGWKGFGRLQAFDIVAQRLHRKHAPGRHWYLWAIGVEPEHQGKGIGHRLVRPVMARADAAGVPCYLETHKEANVPLYERCGFQLVEQVTVPGHPGTVYAMLHRPG
jgi:ribosomal protein S18 acetylase RimI-like enzyme